MGVAVSEDGAEQGSMGVAVGDYDHSGRFSLFTSPTSRRSTTPLPQRRRPLHRRVVPLEHRRRQPALRRLGHAFFDYDNDTWLDLIAVNGHVYPQLDKARLGASAGYRQRKLLYRNLGDGTFDEVGRAVRIRAHRGAREPRPRGRRPRQRRRRGPRDQRPRRSRRRSCATSWRARALADREAARKRPRTPTRSAPVVTVKTGATTQKRLVQSGTSYLSQNDMRQHFGLGSAAMVDRIEVTWPDGTRSRSRTVKADQIVEIQKALNVNHSDSPIAWTAHHD